MSDDEKYCRSIFKRIGFRSQVGSSEVRIYYAFITKDPHFSFLQELDIVSTTPKDTWTQLRAFAEPKIIKEDVKL